MKEYNDAGDEHFYFMTIDAENTIDASRMSNLARFMNHSCEPNCQTQKWTVDGEVCVGLFTAVPVPCGTELVFNYGLDRRSGFKMECRWGPRPTSLARTHSSHIG